MSHPTAWPQPASPVWIAMYAARQAASTVFSELDPYPNTVWHEPAHAGFVVRLGAYACREPRSGETLWLFGGAEGQLPAIPWPKVGFSRRQAFIVFAETAWAVSQRLKAELAAREKAAPPAPAAGLAREDSIFEELDGLGEIRPEARAPGTHPTPRPSPRPSPHPSPQRGEGAADAEFPAEPGGVVGPVGSPVPGEKPPALTIGEAPARRPVNKGGRGRTKGR